MKKIFCISFLFSCLPEDNHLTSEYLTTNGQTTTMSLSTTNEVITTSSFSTSDQEPFCGDLIVNNNEECEENEDRCFNCYRDRYVFATTEKFPSSFLKGIENGNELCKQYAKRGNLDNSENFRIWLSDSETNAIDNVNLCEKCRYVLSNLEFVAYGSEFAKNFPNLNHSINANEIGNLVDAYVWTGTYSNGLKTSQTCLDWTTKNGNEKGYFGSTTEINSSWTMMNNKYNPGGCNLPLVIYCFEGK